MVQTGVSPPHCLCTGQGPSLTFQVVRNPSFPYPSLALLYRGSLSDLAHGLFPLPLPCLFSGWLTLTCILTLSPDPSVSAAQGGCRREETPHPTLGPVHLLPPHSPTSRQQSISSSPETLCKSPLSPPPQLGQWRGWPLTAQGWVCSHCPTPSLQAPRDGGGGLARAGHRPGPCRALHRPLC